MSGAQTTLPNALSPDFTKPLSQALLDLLPQTLTQNETDFQPKILEQSVSQPPPKHESIQSTTTTVTTTKPQNGTADLDACAKECEDVVKPVCGLDFQLGYKIFINKCLLEAQNRCRNSHYGIIKEMGVCVKILESFPSMLARQ